MISSEEIRDDLEIYEYLAADAYQKKETQRIITELLITALQLRDRYRDFNIDADFKTLVQFLQIKRPSELKREQLVQLGISGPLLDLADHIAASPGDTSEEELIEKGFGPALVDIQTNLKLFIDIIELIHNIALGDKYAGQRFFCLYRDIENSRDQVFGQMPYIQVNQLFDAIYARCLEQQGPSVTPLDPAFAKRLIYKQRIKDLSILPIYLESYIEKDSCERECVEMFNNELIQGKIAIHNLLNISNQIRFLPNSAINDPHVNILHFLYAAKQQEDWNDPKFTEYIDAIVSVLKGSHPTRNYEKRQQCVFEETQGVIADRINDIIRSAVIDQQGSLAGISAKLKTVCNAITETREYAHHSVQIARILCIFLNLAEKDRDAIRHLLSKLKESPMLNKVQTAMAIAQDFISDPPIYESVQDVANRYTASAYTIAPYDLAPLVIAETAELTCLVAQFFIKRRDQSTQHFGKSHEVLLKRYNMNMEDLDQAFDFAMEVRRPYFTMFFGTVLREEEITDQVALEVIKMTRDVKHDIGMLFTPSEQQKRQYNHEQNMFQTIRHILQRCILSSYPDVLSDNFKGSFMYSVYGTSADMLNNFGMPDDLDYIVHMAEFLFSKSVDPVKIDKEKIRVYDNMRKVVDPAKFSIKTANPMEMVPTKQIDHVVRAFSIMPIVPITINKGNRFGIGELQYSDKYAVHYLMDYYVQLESERDQIAIVHTLQNCPMCQKDHSAKDFYFDGLIVGDYLDQMKNSIIQHASSPPDHQQLRGLLPFLQPFNIDDNCALLYLCRSPTSNQHFNVFNNKELAFSQRLPVGSPAPVFLTLKKSSILVGRIFDETLVKALLDIQDPIDFVYTYIDYLIQGLGKLAAGPGVVAIDVNTETMSVDQMIWAFAAIRFVCSRIKTGGIRIDSKRNAYTYLSRILESMTKIDPDLQKTIKSIGTHEDIRRMDGERDNRRERMDTTTLKKCGAKDIYFVVQENQNVESSTIHYLFTQAMNEAL